MQSEELKEVAEKLEMISLQIFATLTTVVGVDLNKMELLTGQLGLESLNEQQLTLEPKLDDLRNAVWEFKERITEIKGLL